MDNDGANRGHEHGAEIVYGTHDDNNMVMSEKVNIDPTGPNALSPFMEAELFVSILYDMAVVLYRDWWARSQTVCCTDE